MKPKCQECPVDNTRLRPHGLICRPRLSQLMITPKLRRHSCLMPYAVARSAGRESSLYLRDLEPFPILTRNLGLLRRGQQIAFNLLFALNAETDARPGPRTGAASKQQTLRFQPVAFSLSVVGREK